MSRGAALRWALLAVGLVAVGVALRQLPLLRWVTFGARAAHGAGLPGALVALLAVYLLTLLLLPIVPLTLAAGWVYGPLGGAVLGLAAAVASAASAFSIARHFGRTAAARSLLRRPRTRALAELAEQGGLLTVVLVRISPMLPFTPSNAVMGLTGMRLRDLAAGTALGMAPGTLLYAWAGSLLPSAEALERGESVHGGVVWLLLALGAAAAVIMGAAAARKLRSLPRSGAGRA